MNRNTGSDWLTEYFAWLVKTFVLVITLLGFVSLGIAAWTYFRLLFDLVGGQ